MKEGHLSYSYPSFYFAFCRVLVKMPGQVHTATSLESLEIDKPVTKPRALVMRLCWKAAAFALVGCLLAAFPSEGAAESSFSPLTVARQQDKLAVSTQLDEDFFSTVEDAIKSGIPTTFSFEIEIWSQHRLWSDKSIVSKAVDRIIRFNSLANEYQVVQRSDSLLWQRTTKSLQEVKDWTTTVEGIPLIELSELDPQQTYYIRTRATVTTEKSRSALKYMLFMIPWTGKKTSWEQSEPFAVGELKTYASPTTSPMPSAANP